MIHHHFVPKFIRLTREDVFMIQSTGYHQTRLISQKNYFGEEVYA